MLCVKRVSASLPLHTMTSVWSAVERPSTRDASDSRLRLSIVADSYPNLAEARRRGALCRTAGLHRFAFSAVRSTPCDPRVLIADGITGIPELRCHAGVRGILEHAATLAVFYFPTDLAAELKVEAMIVDRPRAVALHIDAVLDVVEEIFERRVAGEQVEVAHANHRHVLPVLRAHACVTFTTYGARRIVAHLVAHEHAVADDVGGHAFAALIVVPDGRQPLRKGVVDEDVHDVRTVFELAQLCDLEKTYA